MLPPPVTCAACGHVASKAIAAAWSWVPVGAREEPACSDPCVDELLDRAQQWRDAEDQALLEHITEQLAACDVERKRFPRKVTQWFRRARLSRWVGTDSEAAR